MSVNVSYANVNVKMYKCKNVNMINISNSINSKNN